MYLTKVVRFHDRNCPKLQLKGMHWRPLLVPLASCCWQQPMYSALTRMITPVPSHEKSYQNSWQKLSQVAAKLKCIGALCLVPSCRWQTNVFLAKNELGTKEEKSVGVLPVCQRDLLSIQGNLFSELKTFWIRECSTFGTLLQPVGIHRRECRPWRTAVGCIGRRTPPFQTRVANTTHGY